MYLNVCVCVCTYVRTYVCMYVCMYVCTYVGMYVCMYVPFAVYKFQHLHVKHNVRRYRQQCGDTRSAQQYCPLAGSGLPMS